jgi:hypothetical protein
MNDDETMKAIQNNELRFSKPDWFKVSQAAKDLIIRMLDRSQTTRIKASEILEDKWFTLRDKQHQKELAEADEAETSKINTTENLLDAQNTDQTKSAVRFGDEENSDRSAKQEKAAPSQKEVRSLPKYKSKSNYKQSTMITPVIYLLFKLIISFYLL